MRPAAGRYSYTPSRSSPPQAGPATGWSPTSWPRSALARLLLANGLRERRDSLGVARAGAHVPDEAVGAGQVVGGAPQRRRRGVGVIERAAEHHIGAEQRPARARVTVLQADRAGVDHAAPGGEPVERHVGVADHHGLLADRREGRTEVLERAVNQDVLVVIASRRVAER